MTSGSKFLLVRKHFALAKVERHSCPQSSFTCLCAHSPQPGAHHPATTKKVCHCKFHSIIISSSMLNLRRLARRKTKSLLPTNGWRSVAAANSLFSSLSFGSSFQYAFSKVTCILKKCQSKLDCLIFEMLFIRKLKPKLNKQWLDPREAFYLAFLYYSLMPQFLFILCVYCFYVNILEF